MLHKLPSQSPSTKETQEQLRRAKLDTVSNQAINSGWILVMAPEPSQFTTITGSVLIIIGTTIRIIIGFTE